LLERFEGHTKAQKIISTSNIIINLSILGVFKYFNFFVDNLNFLIHSLFDYELGWVTLQLVLPVGISFYTFQALSYSIDVYKHTIKATHDPVEFFAFISFFPQLVAGPIERATHLLPQFQRNRCFDYSKATDGLRQMLWGFVKKLLVADNCAAIVNQYWSQYSVLPGSLLIILGILFTFQIYCDFSGYSDIAIGCARLFGFDLMSNFNYPYFSRSIPEFWRRWHISLTTWFRDYIYFPLGGSRTNKRNTIRNIFIVWGISGLWHGANWTFVCWGLFHALILSIYIILGVKTNYKQVVADGHILPNIKEILQITFTFFLCVIGWILFRAESMHQAVDYFGSLFSNSFYDGSCLPKKQLFSVGIAIFLLLTVEWIHRNKQHALQSLSSFVLFKYRFLRWTLYFALIILLIFNLDKGQEFIYFQF